MSEHKGLEELFDIGTGTYTTENPENVEEPMPDEVVEHKATVMSKLMGSVSIPEEFKFADNITF